MVPLRGGDPHANIKNLRFNRRALANPPASLMYELPLASPAGNSDSSDSVPYPYAVALLVAGFFCLTQTELETEKPKCWT